MKKYFLICFLIVFSACDNEIDINADWKDIPVIYAIFDSGSRVDADGSLVDDIDYPLNMEHSFNQDGDSDYDLNTLHYVRVQKSFLGSLSANSYMGVSDSIYYNSDDLDVWVERVDVNTGSVGIIYDLELVTDVDKYDGDFHSSSHYLFQLPESISELCGPDGTDMSKKYRISVLNNNTGEIASAETNIVQPIHISKPTHGSVVLNTPLTINALPDIRFAYSRNAKMYSVIVRFNYIEQTKSGYLQEKSSIENGNAPTIDTVHKYIEHTITDDYTVDDLNQIGTEEIPWNSGAFLSQINNELSQGMDVSDPQFYRYPLWSYAVTENSQNTIIHRCIDIYVTAANASLYTYLDNNTPSNNINQERPQYNNVNNGVGHVSSRSRARVVNLRVGYLSVNDEISSIEKNNFACYELNSQGDGNLGYTISFPPDCN